ncbi:YhgE/Pip domain-containing protein [Microbacterium flavum]|uniref:YhgE/Pip domain-containing protein n=1 Tax=Microbacterium flavum TaxID=415216 RepID=UPI0024AD8CBC|nr:YhgE/Pip domain-containing protein [Microbacterium flavum]
MRKSLRVFRRDVTRIFRAPRTWVIVLGVLLTPALYAWFNITAFWDPYSETANIRVAVVDLDEGARSDLTGPVDIGAQVVDQLKADHQLGWQFMDEDAAQQAVRSGDVYATIVIPADFSADLLSITTGTFTQPALQYYVNEKSSAIAPKITDVGAAGIDGKISSAFIEQVADAATTALKDAGDSAVLKLLNAKNDSLNAFDSAGATVGAARAGIVQMRSDLENSRASLSNAKATLGDVDTTLGDVQTAIGQAQTILAQAQKDVLNFTDAATSAYVQGTTLLADASAQANVSISHVTQALGQAGTRIDTALTDVTAVVDANAAAIAQLQQLIDGGQLDPAVAAQLQEVVSALQAQNTADQQLLADLTSLSANSGSTVQAVQDAADALNTAVQGAQTSASGLRDALSQSIPALTSAMSALSSSAGGFSAALTAQRAQLTQAAALLDGLDGQFVATSSALDSLDGNLAGIQTGLDGARTDVLALGSASSWRTLSTVTGLEPQQIAQFVATPVDIATHTLFPVATYGSAMAALFTNLSLWIGAFVLMVIFKVEVDTEGVAPITVRQAYVGRFLLFGTLAVLQAVVVSVGNLVVGVQTVNAFAFVGTSVLISLAYVSIIYALCVSFGHVGRGLCILLVIMQIPGASGLYPIELMPSFFRNIYPFLPFTYGIDAMRETIAGFYGAHWWRFMGVLALFVLLSWGLGLVLRRRLANLNRLFNREIAATDLLIGEDVQVTGRGYRLTDVIHALSDRGRFQSELDRRARPFAHRYPDILRVTLLVGLGGMVVLGVIAWLVREQSATLLFLWMLWILLVIAFLVVLEYVKHSFAVAGELSAMGEDDLRRAMAGADSAWGARWAPAPETPATEPVAVTAAAPTVVLVEQVPVDDPFTTLFGDAATFPPAMTAEDAASEPDSAAAEAAETADPQVPTEPGGTETAAPEDQTPGSPEQREGGEGA